MCNDAVLCVSLPQRLSLLLRAAPNWALLTSFCSVNGCQTYLSFLSTVFWEEEGFWEGTEQMVPRLSLQVTSHATPSGGSLPPEEVGEHFFEYCCSRDVQLVCVWLLLGFLWRWKGWLRQSYHDIVNKHHPSFLLGHCSMKDSVRISAFQTWVQVLLELQTTGTISLKVV